MNRISEFSLSRFSEFITARVGLHFPKERQHDLARGLASAAREFGFADPETLVCWLLTEPIQRNQIEILARHLTVGETYFFRDQKQFEILEREIIPEFEQSRRSTERRLRIWSAGCATGEEPYSVAILLTRLIPDIETWNITILATDINPHSLRKASDGVYTDWSFRNAPNWIKQNYFRAAKDGRYELEPRIRSMVQFSYLNLAEDNFPSLLTNTNAMDLIICRNVLMYFAPDRIRAVVRNFHRALTDGGWLVVGAAETSQALFSDFGSVNFPDATLYKKEISKASSWRLLLDSREEPEPVPLKLFSSALQPKNEPTLNNTLPSAEIGERAAEHCATTSYEGATALFSRGHYDEAAAQLVALMSEHSDPALLSLLTRIYANQGKLAEALESCDKAIAAERLNPTLYYLRATILQEQNRTEEAIRALKQALFLDHDFVLAHFALANLQLHCGKPGKSGKHFETALTLLKRRPEEEILPESDGMSAGRLTEIIRTVLAGDSRHG